MSEALKLKVAQQQAAHQVWLAWKPIYWASVVRLIPRSAAAALLVLAIGGSRYIYSIYQRAGFGLELWEQAALDVVLVLLLGVMFAVQSVFYQVLIDRKAACRHIKNQMKVEKSA